MCREEPLWTETTDLTGEGARGHLEQDSRPGIEQHHGPRRRDPRSAHQATGIYATAYGCDPEFYSFTRSLESYEKVMDSETMFILGTDSELLKYLEGPN
jgi:hypothetical protein